MDLPRWLRRRRVDVGTFEPPPAKPLSPADQVVADALTIACHAVKMTVKNELIVGALRDAKPFDHAALVGTAREEYVRLADASRATAARLHERLEQDEADEEDWVYPGGKPVVVDDEQRRGPAVLHAVADAMEAESRDTQALDRIVHDAKAAAWDEVGGALAQRLAARRVGDDPDYLAQRDARLQQFIRDELTGL
jgi:hypothetical protein